MTYRDLLSKVHDHPFRPFRIRMVNGTAYDIREPWMIMVGESSAVVATNARKDDRGFEVITDWRTVSITHMAEFADIESSKNGGRKRSK